MFELGQKVKVKRLSLDVINQVPDDAWKEFLDRLDKLHEVESKKINFQTEFEENKQLQFVTALEFFLQSALVEGYEWS